MSVAHAKSLDKRIAGLGSAVSRMTPGPWLLVDQGYGERNRYFFAKDVGLNLKALPKHAPQWNFDEDNLAGLVALRNDALAIIRDLASENERLREGLERIEKYPMTRRNELSTAGVREIARAALRPTEPECS